jgi:hypothetical protein
MVAKREVPGCEKIEDQGDRRGDRQWNDWPTSERCETVNEPQEDAQVEEGTDAVYDSVSAPLMDGTDILAVGKRMLPIQVPGKRDGGGKRAKTCVQQVEIENTVQQRENSAIDEKANRADNDESPGLLDHGG